ncbi:hypothetical protein OXYTRIMIC_362 [Oxytricha trifallax]|uniref:Uncharacterized protein n=1 Tax=Oxytricha trifallax TaxID=1172189 RepID=A0A073HYL0_9SPIT|nr:hypothetical protein OXYTRIMIC_362 [Oxytricha trifallax]
MDSNRQQLQIGSAGQADITNSSGSANDNTGIVGFGQSTNILNQQPVINNYYILQNPLFTMMNYGQVQYIQQPPSVGQAGQNSIPQQPPIAHNPLQQSNPPSQQTFAQSVPQQHGPLQQNTNTTAPTQNQITSLDLVQLMDDCNLTLAQQTDLIDVVQHLQEALQMFALHTAGLTLKQKLLAVQLLKMNPQLLSETHDVVKTLQESNLSQ